MLILLYVGLAILIISVLTLIVNFAIMMKRMEASSGRFALHALAIGGQFIGGIMIAIPLVYWAVKWLQRH